ncbi:hypothetical protein V6H34_004965 [Vibrio harveyi]
MNLRTIKTEIQLRGSWSFEVEYDAENLLTKLNFTHDNVQYREQFVYAHDHMLAQYQLHKKKVLVEDKQLVRYGLV